MSTEYDVAIHWVRNGLRLHDNPPFLDACQKSKNLLPLYVIDTQAPFSQTVGRPAGAIRANFILESMSELDKKLKKLESELMVVLGDPIKAVPEVVAHIGATALFYEQESADPIRRADQKMLKAIKDRVKKDGLSECKVHGYATHTLHPMEKYLQKCEGHTAPSSYGKFTKMFNGMTVPHEVANVDKVPPLPDGAKSAMEAALGKEQVRMPRLSDLGYNKKQLEHRALGGFDFVGGEDAALQHLQDTMQRAQYVATFRKPQTIPNDDQKPSTTALSPYVKHGCLSPRRFYHELSTVYAKFDSSQLSSPPESLHGQLMWREYNYLMGYSTPNFDKMVDNPIARQIPWDDDPELVAAWKEARTGYPFVDAIMTQLRATGWIHHLARHMVACFLTRGDLWQSWEEGAAVFEEFLIDADWSINNFNWQWLSCTAHFYQYFRCYSPVTFGKKTDKNGDYIRKWLPQFKNFPSKYIYEPWSAPLDVQKKHGVVIGKDYPHPIVDHKVASKTNMARMKEAYDAHKAGEDMPNPPSERPDEIANDDSKRPPRKSHRTS